MKTRIVLLLALVGAFASNLRPVLGAPGGPAALYRLAERPANSSAAVPGGLEKPLPEPWHMYDRQSGQHREARTCQELLALDATSDPMEVSDDGSPPTRLIQNDWDVYGGLIVDCRVVAALQSAKPARVDYLGAFRLDNARLKEIPAAVIPTPSPREEKRLQEASARGVSWKGWDRRIHVTGTFANGITVEGSDVRASLVVKGRGDFDGDGIDDLFLERSGGGREGTWRSTAVFVLTRRAARGRVEILKVIE